MRAASLYFIATIFLFTSCGGGNQKMKEQRVAKGGVKYGGYFRCNESEYFKSLFPLGITETVGHHIISQIYEGLVAFNPKDLTIEPALAENWTVSPDAKTYTFKIRKGVYFQDDTCFKGGKGRPVTAGDFVYCFNLLCSPDVKNSGYSFYTPIIAGAQQHFKALQNHDAAIPPIGVVALNDSTLQIDLAQPSADFLSRLALPFASLFPKEALDYYKGEIHYNAVGTGPFRLKAVKQDDAVVLVRNNKYWGKDEFGNQLPYMNGIKVSFIKEDKTEMLEFEKGNFDMKYRLPFDMIDDIIDDHKQLKGEYKKYVLQIMPELTTQFYGFLVQDKVFADRNVRLAFNYAIDRAKIADYTAKGEGIPCFNGLVPLGMPGYDNNLVKGYTFDVAKAKAYLAQAGYPDGKGFPKVTLEINSGGGRNEKVAETIQKMLIENLGIDVEITQVVWAQHTNNIETAKANFWRFSWVADYPDPINFLNLLYGKNVPKTFEESSYTNPFRYVNPKYDALYEKALSTLDAGERNKLYAQLDQMVVDDAPFLPIYYSVNRRLIQPYVRNLYANGMEYRDFKEVWLDNK
jgi:oligopeptide transport system substrate-binding protein